MKIWVTRYALIYGIQETESIEVHWHKETCLAKRLDTMEHGPPVYMNKPDWHKTKEAAIQRAREMRDERIAELEAEIARLKGMRFEE